MQEGKARLAVEKAQAQNDRDGFQVGTGGLPLCQRACLLMYAHVPNAALRLLPSAVHSCMSPVSASYGCLCPPLLCSHRHPEPPCPVQLQVARLEEEAANQHNELPPSPQHQPGIAALVHIT